MKKLFKKLAALLLALMIIPMLMTTPAQAGTKIDAAVNFAVSIANNSTHGYDQTYRWGPNYDCSSLVITAYQNAGVPVKSNGATYTGNMYSVFTRTGFVNVKSSINMTTGAGLRKGDVLLSGGHTAMVSNVNGSTVTIVHASINEFNGITGGKSGDQTGREICTRSYYNGGWTSVLRYTKDTTPVNTSKVYFKRYAGTSGSLVDALVAIGADSSYAYRARIAAKNNIANYSGTAAQNTQMLNLLKAGKLVRP